MLLHGIRWGTDAIALAMLLRNSLGMGGGGGVWNIIVKVVLLGAVANVSCPPFPPSGSVLLVLPHCSELAISMTTSD